MTLDQFRDAANSALADAKKAILNDPDDLRDLLKQAPLVSAETNVAPRIEVLQAIEEKHLNILALISNTVSAFQTYQTAALNPEGLGDNAPTDGTDDGPGKEEKSNN